jgi:AcrR family transcriptional regulator
MANKILQGDRQREETTPCAVPRPRDRILVTARRMFHQSGIRGVGVDAIAEAAGTNKMTLYRHFGSKDDLIVECLRKAVDEDRQAWTDFQAEHRGDPQAQLRAWIRQGAKCIASDSRGCEMANAAVELTEADHPARRLIEDFKSKYRDRLALLCADAGLVQPDLVADMLGLLIEGARVSRQSVGVEGPSARFVRMAEAIIASFGMSEAAEEGVSMGAGIPTIPAPNSGLDALIEPEHPTKRL